MEIRFKKSSLKTVIQKCPECGIKFRPTKTKYKYCSVKCGAIANRKARGQYLTKKCDNCGSKFHIKKFQYEKYNTHFCSRECYSQWKIQHLKGRSNPNWKNASIKECLCCGKKYKNYNKNSKYCSRQCVAVTLKKKFKIKNISLTKNYISGRRYEYKTINELNKKSFQFISRSPQSKGLFDILAIRFGKKQGDWEIRAIQVKSTGNKNKHLSEIMREKKRIFAYIKEFNPQILEYINFEYWFWEKYKKYKIFRYSFLKNDFVLI